MFDDRWMDNLGEFMATRWIVIDDATVCQTWKLLAMHLTFDGALLARFEGFGERVDTIVVPDDFERLYGAPETNVGYLSIVRSDWSRHYGIQSESMSQMDDGVFRIRWDFASLPGDRELVTA